MSMDRLDELLARMPDIAKAVEHFKSEAVQMEAFRALIEAAGSDGGSGGSRPPGNRGEQPPSTPPAKRTPQKRASGKKQTFSMVKGLDFIGGAAQSLNDFVAEKKPTSNPAKSLVVIYWLSRKAEISPVTADHVYTAYRHLQWPVPSDLINTLHQAGSKGWIESKSRDDLTVVVGGENYVEYELPPTPKKQSQSK